MTRFILSDLHIGHKDAQYDVMDQAITYIRKKAAAGDEIWGLGDWFHMYENGFEHCLSHPMTQKFRDLAGEIPTRLMPGNHDHELEKYRDNPSMGNPLSPIILIKPFLNNGLWYCHGHEYDPTVQYLPDWLIWLWNKIPHKSTPGNIRGPAITEKYLLVVQLVHSRALLSLQEKARKEGQNYKGIVLGHTHLPMRQESPDLLFLLNDGDMRHSATFTVEDNTGFHLMRWSSKQNQWSEILVPRP
jgi:UDP-2,3-diacylglucosamine pyrophosphatase LpxH